MSGGHATAAGEGRHDEGQATQGPRARAYGANGRPASLTSPWRELAAHAGGVGKLATALGVTRLTIYRWAHGERTPSALEQTAIDTWARRRGLVAPYAA